MSRDRHPNHPIGKRRDGKPTTDPKPTDPPPKSPR